MWDVVGSNVLLRFSLLSTRSRVEVQWPIERLLSQAWRMVLRRPLTRLVSEPWPTFAILACWRLLAWRSHGAFVTGSALACSYYSISTGMQIGDPRLYHF